MKTTKVGRDSYLDKRLSILENRPTESRSLLHDFLTLVDFRINWTL